MNDEPGNDRQESSSAGAAGADRCPFCREKVQAGALKCPFCGSSIAVPGPQHGGTCYACMESIDPKAVVCKHCGTTFGLPRSLVPPQVFAVGERGCCEGGKSGENVIARQFGNEGGPPVDTFPPGGSGWPKWWPRVVCFEMWEPDGPPFDLGGNLRTPIYTKHVVCIPVPGSWVE